jgi:predicted nucleic acid-binding protein
MNLGQTYHTACDRRRKPAENRELQLPPSCGHRMTRPTVDEENKDHAFGDALSFARKHGLSIYDAAYLELVMRRGLPLATLDDKLKTVAAAIGTPLYGVH